MEKDGGICVGCGVVGVFYQVPCGGVFEIEDWGGESPAVFDCGAVDLSYA